MTADAFALSPHTAQCLLWLHDPRGHSHPARINPFRSLFGRVCGAALGSVQAEEWLAQADFVVIDLDFPTPATLQAIAALRTRLPTLPLLLLCVEHSEELILWALRQRLWDFYHCPLTASHIQTICLNMRQQLQARDLAIPLHNCHPERGPAVGCTPQRGHSGSRCNMLAVALQFIHENFHRKLALADVAHVCQCNGLQLRRRFQKELNMTFQDYLLNYRISIARQLLENPRAVISTVCGAVGFRDPSYFTRIFRRQVGVSPSAYMLHHNPTAATAQASLISKH